jgi:hypothetical protein
MRFRAGRNHDAHPHAAPHLVVCAEASRTDERQVSDSPHLSTVAEIEERIAADRQHYISAYFAGDEGEAQYWVLEIARLENLRNIVQRTAGA